MWKDFKEFAVRGNVVDMAVGIIIGAAFGTIARSLVDDIIMPPIGLLLGNVNFTGLFAILKVGPNAAPPYATLAEAKAAGAVTINYGLFITNVITFLIVAFSVFILVKSLNKLKRKEEAIPPAAPTSKLCPFCQTQISIKAVKCPACTSPLEAKV